MKPSVSAVIFDLDGTLLASLEDLADSVNTVLDEFSFPTHPLEPYKYFVGDGMENLVRRAAPPDTPDTVLSAILSSVMREYGQHWARKSRPYDGIMPMLAELEARRIPMAVLSNKPHAFTVEVMDHFFADIRFTAIQGSPPGSKAKPDPALALAIAGQMRLAPEQVAFMGDTRTDMETANNAGMPPIGVLWGFRPERELLDHGAKVILARPEDFFHKVDFSIS